MSRTATSRTLRTAVDASTRRLPRGHGSERDETACRPRSAHGPAGSGRSPTPSFFDPGSRMPRPQRPTVGWAAGGGPYPRVARRGPNPLPRRAGRPCHDRLQPPGVRAAPVQPSARRAAGELLVGAAGTVREQMGYLLLTHRLEDTVAGHAP